MKTPGFREVCIDPATESSTEAETGPLRYDYRPGQRLVYRVEERRVAEGVLAPPGGVCEQQPPCRIAIEVAGTWILTVLARDASAATLVVSMEDVSLSVTAGGRPLEDQAMADLRDAFRAGVAARITPRGEVERTWFPRPMPPKARQMVACLLLELHLHLPEMATDAWEEEEQDATGTYLAAYRVGPERSFEDGRPLTPLTREKKGYVSITAASGQSGAWRGAHNGTGKSEAWFARDSGCVVELESQERFDYRDDGSGQVLSATGSSSFRVLGRSMLPTEEIPDADSLIASLEDVPVCAAGGGESDPAGEARRRRQRAQGKSASSLLVELGRLDLAGQASSGQAMDAVESLAALFEVDEKAIREAMDTVRRGACSKTVSSQVFCALGMCGTTACQAALSEVLSWPSMPPELQQAALFGVVAVRLPEAGLAEATRRVSEGRENPVIARTGLLAMGSIASSLLDASSPRAAEVLAYLEARYSKADDVRDRVAALEALGNAGSPSAMGLISAASKDVDERVRGAAMTGLRRVSTAEAESILLGALEDRSPLVRLRAVDALAGRGTPESLTAIRRVAESDASAEVRSMAKQVARR